MCECPTAGLTVDYTKAPPLCQRADLNWEAAKCDPNQQPYIDCMRAGAVWDGTTCTYSDASQAQAQADCIKYGNTWDGSKCIDVPATNPVTTCLATPGNTWDDSTQQCTRDPVWDCNQMGVGYSYDASTKTCVSDTAAMGALTLAAPAPAPASPAMLVLLAFGVLGFYFFKGN